MSLRLNTLCGVASPKGFRALRGAVEPRFSSLPWRVIGVGLCKGTAAVAGLADGQGFEPWVPVKEHTLSKRAHSTALPPIRLQKRYIVGVAALGNSWLADAPRQGVIKSG